MIKRGLLALCLLFGALPALAQTPGSVQTEINFVPWTNGLQRVTGAEIYAILTDLTALWTSYGPTAFAPALSGTVTNEMLCASPSIAVDCKNLTPSTVNGAYAIAALTYTDSLDATPVGSASILTVFDKINSTAAGGGHVAVTGELVISALPTSAGNYVGVYGFAEATVNLGGTDTGAGAAGKVFGMNPQAAGVGTATNLAGVVGGEVDVTCGSGCSTKNKFGWNITTIGSDATQGTSRDAALLISASGASSPGWLKAILIDRFGGDNPVSSGGTILEASGGYTVAYGINLSGITCTTFCFSATGPVQAGSYSPTSSTNPGVGLYAPISTQLGFATNGSFRMGINQSGVVLVQPGNNSAHSINNGTATPKFEVSDNENLGNNGAAFFSYINSTTTPATLYFAQSQTTTLGTQAAVTAGTQLGAIFSEGSDGTQFQNASEIITVAEGTISAGVVPGRVEFYTANSSGVLTKALTIDSAGVFTTPLVPSGTPVASLCLDGANRIVKKTTAGSCV